MKTVLFTLILFLSSSSLLAQYPYQSMMGPGSVIFGSGYYAGSVPSTMMLGDAAMINAQSGYLLNQSEANINNQTAFSMYLHNRLLYTKTFFENRQLNSYYRDLETWQKETRRELKRSGLYDREAIEYIYGNKR